MTEGKQPEKEQVNQFLLDRLWNAYSMIDDKRRKSFYHLFSEMTVFGLLWLTKDDSCELPIIKTKVQIPVMRSVDLTEEPSTRAAITISCFWDFKLFIVFSL